MSGAEAPEPTRELLQKLERADSQLALYARDLKRIVDSEKKKARELAEANARLEILDRLKTDFLSFISHELRTPLATLSMVDHLDPGTDPDDTALLLEAIRSGYSRLQELIEKGLEYFDWLAKGRSDLTEKVNLDDIVSTIAYERAGIAGRDGDVRFSVPNAPCPVWGDRENLSRMVRILVDNAIKFSRPGTPIEVKLKRADRRAVLTVSNQGVGIPAGMLKEIFQPFIIADVMHHSSGTGLNLSIAGAIVEAHGGSIRAESPGVGRGATFIVDLPLLADDFSPPTEPAHAD